MAYDSRLTPARPDLAAERLRGIIEAPRYAAPTPMRVTSATAPLFSRPGAKGLAAELVLGAEFEVYEAFDGLAWGQATRDGYVGYVPEAALAPARPARHPATHRVTALLSTRYPAADIKTVPLGLAPLNALLAGRIEGDFLVTDQGCVPAVHVAPLDAPPAPDWVAACERFLGAPYLWGGGSPLGLDCSGLIQAGRWAAGYECPRDSDMQAVLGAEIPQADPLSPEALRRGDLVFWKGHVGVMLDAEILLHANAHHMAVAAEPLRPAIARIKAAEAGAPTAFRRLD